MNKWDGDEVWPLQTNGHLEGRESRGENVEIPNEGGTAVHWWVSLGGKEISQCILPTHLQSSFQISETGWGYRRSCTQVNSNKKMWGKPVSPRAGAQASATRGRIYRQREDRRIRSDKPREFISWQTRFKALFFLLLSFPPPSPFLSFLLLPHSFLPSFSLFPSIFSLPLSLSLSFCIFLSLNNISKEKQQISIGK